MRSSSSMTALHSSVESSRGSRRPDDDRQCTHARLQANVSSQVRQIGASSPCFSCWTRRSTATDALRVLEGIEGGDEGGPPALLGPACPQGVCNGGVVAECADHLQD